MSESKELPERSSTIVYTPAADAVSSQLNQNDHEIRKWLEENNISEVECLVPDMTGNARGKFIPAHQFLSRSDLKLPESIMVQTVTGEYTDEHWDFVEPTDTDMLLVADPKTLRKVPWAREPTAQVIADCYMASGEPHPLSSRNVLRHVLALYEAA